MNKRLIPLILATFISDFGSALTVAALPVLFIQTGHYNGIAVYNGIESVGALVGAVWIFGLIDRVRKNWLAAVSDLVRAAALLPLILIPSTPYSGVILYSLANSLFGAATSSAVAGWITERFKSSQELRHANSALEVASQIGRAAAPAVGAILLAKHTIQSVFIIDAATYVVGAMIVLRISTGKIERIQAQTASFLSESTEGLKACLANKKLLKWIGVSGAQFFGLAVMNTVYLTLLSQQVHASAKEVAFFQTAYFIGALVGSGHGLVSKLTLERALQLSSMGLGLVMMGAALATQYWVFFGLAALQSYFTITSAISTRSLCQQSAGVHLAGRVMAFRSAAIDVFGIFSYGLALIFSRFVSTHVLLGFGAVSFVFAAGFAWTSETRSGLLIVPDENSTSG